ncbi:MAG TPA: hypothetical protein VNA20_03730 [Frankiaceae bacterium]|nr:hypothetical protein [Frankiaceae bacterium]
MRKILAVAAATAFAGTFFTGTSYANDPCVTVKAGDPMYIYTVVGTFPVPGTVTVDPDPQGCITMVTDYLP